jgi:hypothetical protein
MEAMMKVENRGRDRGEPAESNRGVLLILIAVVLAGLAAGYNWWRALPR